VNYEFNQLKKMIKALAMDYNRSDA